IELFESQRVQGLLVTPLGRDLATLEGLRDRGMPVVLIDYSDPADGFSVVSVDHQRGGSAAVEHLVELGRRRIALISGPVAFTQVADRYQGAQTAAAAAGAWTTWVDAPSLTIEGGVVAAHRILAMDPSNRPDAIFAPNDL